MSNLIPSPKVYTTIEVGRTPTFGRVLLALAVKYPLYTFATLIIFFCLGTLAMSDKDEAPLPYSEARVISPELEEELQPQIDIVEIEPTPKTLSDKQIKRIEKSGAKVRQIKRNDTAPTLQFTNPKQFLAKAVPIARKVSRETGVPTSIILAQSMVESGAGSSFLAVNANNFFGHKCFSKSCRKGHCINRTDDTHKDFFVKYASMEASFRAHAQKISSGRYKSLMQYGNNYVRWASGLKKKGYATDRNYSVALVSTIKKYGLDRY